MKTTTVITVLLICCIKMNAQSPTPVSLERSKDSAMAWLKGSAVYDPKSKKSVSLKWFLQSGTTNKINIVSPTDSLTKVKGLIPGSYVFGFVVRDKRLNKADTAYKKITVKKFGT
ncbi:MAG: hypothetical protein JST87_03735 [Bacteroidetes bacterium]|nr:hypothetical protein [Bacteroidota bacterium]